ncbi:hypothetical protein ACOMHN_057527 [Nucella lapillus]
MSGHWPSRGVSTIPLRNSARNAPEEQQQPKFVRGRLAHDEYSAPILGSSGPQPHPTLSRSGSHSSALSGGSGSSTHSGSPRPSPAPSLSRRGGDLPQSPTFPGSSPGLQRPPRDPELRTGPVKKPPIKNQPPGGFYTPGHSPVVPSRRFHFPQDEFYAVRASSLPRNMPPPSQRVAGSSSPRGVVVVLGHDPEDGGPEEEVVDYPHQQMYVGACFGDSPKVGG